MRAIIHTRTSLVWLILVVATMVALRAGFDLPADLRLARVAVLGIAFIKVRIVLREFMELRAAPLPMRRVVDVWCIGVCGALIALFLGAA